MGLKSFLDWISGNDDIEPASKSDYKGFGFPRENYGKGDRDPSSNSDTSGNVSGKD